MYVTTLYRLLKKMHEDGEYLFHSKWVAKVKSILESSGLGNVRLEQEHVNIVWIQKALDLRLKDIGKQNWHSEVNMNGQCTNYRIFKNHMHLKLICFDMIM